MNQIRQRCRELGLNLPSVTPRGSYRTVVRYGNMLFLSGQVSRVGDSVIAGPVDELSQTDREAAARAAALRSLAVLADELRPEERLRILKLTVYILSGPEFQEHAQVADCASRLLIDVLGEASIGSRTAIGVASLPSSGAVELDIICTTEMSDA